MARCKGVCLEENVKTTCHGVGLLANWYNKSFKQPRGIPIPASSVVIIADWINSLPAQHSTARISKSNRYPQTALFIIIIINPFVAFFKLLLTIISSELTSFKYTSVLNRSYVTSEVVTVLKCSLLSNNKIDYSINLSIRFFRFVI